MMDIKVSKKAIYGVILSLPFWVVLSLICAGLGYRQEPGNVAIVYAEPDVSGNDAEKPSLETALETAGTAEAAGIQVSDGDAGGLAVNSAYPAPEYDFTVDEITVKVKGLERDYNIAFVNDLHLITDRASGDVTEDNLSIVRNRFASLAVTPDGVHAEDLWPEVIKYLNYYEFDAVILGGDILDYCSNSNIIALNDGLKKLRYPSDRIMYIRSDHDYGGWYGGNGFTDSDGFQLQTLVLDGDRQEKYIEFDDFIIVGINQSYRQISKSAYEELTRNLNRGKPVIVATHVPFYSEVDDSLKEVALEKRNRIYYWSPDSELYTPDKETKQLITHMYARNSNVVQIVAAHMHTAWDGYVTKTIKEHIFAPSFEGKIGIIHVTGE